MYASRSSFSPFDNKAKTASSKSNNAAITPAGNNNTTNTNTTNTNNNNNSHVSTVEPFFRFDANDQHAFLEIELPGVTKPDVSVELNGHVMTITAMRYRSTHLLMLKDWSHHRSDSGDVNATADNNDDENDDENDGDNGDVGDDEHATDQQEEQQDQEKQKQQTQQRIPSFLYSLEMRLASAANVENITCLHFRDGVLTIHIPARGKISPRFLPIP